MSRQTADSLIALANQAKLIELAQQLLSGQTSVTPIFEYSGYTGVVVEEYLTAHFRDNELVVQCEFPDEGDTGPEDNIGHIFIKLDGKNNFTAEF